MNNNADHNQHDSAPDDVERTLDQAGQAFRDRWIERPPDAPDDFIEAVREVRTGAAHAPTAFRIKVIAATAALAACLALVVLFVPRSRDPEATETPVADQNAGETYRLNPLSAGALRLRNQDRPLDDPDLPSASIVHWVTETNPLGP